METSLNRILGQRNVDRLVLCRAFIFMNGRKLLKTLLPNCYRLNNASNRVFSDGRHHVFFGYYDITPFSSDDTMLLAMYAPLINRSPDPKSIVKVGWYDLRDVNPKFEEIGETATWCWQQGCRLQWHPLADNKTVLYNNIVNGTYGCILKDIHTREIKRQYGRPFYTVSNDGKWALSINMSRLQRLRPGYGYGFLPDDTLTQKCPQDDGVWRINLETGEEKLLFSVADIRQIEQKSDMNGANHYFNHLLFNDIGSRFLFVHLWQKNDKSYSRLLTSDINGQNIFLLNNDGHTSHYCWKSANEILSFATHKDTGTMYYLYQDMSLNRMAVGKDILKSDGHPTFCVDDRFIVLDTYPDKSRVQTLFLYDAEKNKTVKLLEYFSPLKYSGEFRCDLHPRVSPSGYFVSVDHIVSGRRAISVFDLKSVLHDQGLLR